MAKKSKKNRQKSYVPTKPPELSEDQQQAHLYLLYLQSNDKALKTSPPVCKGCGQTFTNFEDVYEIMQSNACGFCQAWEGVPEDIKTQVSTISQLQPTFTSVLRRLIPHRPNIARLLPTPL